MPPSLRSAAASAALAAVLAPTQVAAAQLTGLATFAGPFDAGNDRVIGVASSLLVWCCALAVITGGLVRGRRRPISIAAAAVGAAATGLAVAVPLADPVIADDVPWAVLGGVLLGAAVSAALMGTPRAATVGIAVHAATVWGVALIAVAFVDPTLLYPG